MADTSFFDSLTAVNGVQDTPYFGIVMGAGGVGKSYFCSYADSPFFIPLEPGVDKIPVKKFPVLPATFDQFMDMMRWCTANKKAQGIKTVVIDSAGFLEPLIYADIIKKNPYTEGKEPKEVQSIADYGFGKGYTKAIGYWERVISSIRFMQGRGMNVIIITHTINKSQETPTGDSYKTIDMALQSFGNSSVPELLKRAADFVFYMESQVMTMKAKSKFGAEQTRPIPGLSRSIAVHTRATGSFFAKVRAVDERNIANCYEIRQDNYEEDSKKIFSDFLKL